MVSVGLFTNVNSGKNILDLRRYGKNRRIKRLRSIVKDGNKGKIYITGKTRDYMTDLESKIQEAYQDRPDVIAIDGGDGTISTVLSTLNKYWQEELPPIAIIEGGTFNVLEKRLDIKNPFNYLQNITRTDDVNNLTLGGVNMMHVYDDSGNDHLSFSVGVGLPVYLLEEVYQKKHMKYLRVALMMLRMIGSALVDGEYQQKFNKKAKIQVTAQGHNGEITKQANWLAIMAQSIDTMGLPKFLPKSKLFRKAETEDRFQAIGSTLEFRKLLQYFPAIYTGDSPSLTDSSTDEITPVLTLDHQLKDMKLQSEEPFRYQFNGELSYGRKACITRELYITAGKNINFIKDDF